MHHFLAPFFSDMSFQKCWQKWLMKRLLTSIRCRSRVINFVIEETANSYFFSHEITVRFFFSCFVFLFVCWVSSVILGKLLLLQIVIGQYLSMGCILSTCSRYLVLSTETWKFRWFPSSFPALPLPMGEQTTLLTVETLRSTGCDVLSLFNRSWANK